MENILIGFAFIIGIIVITSIVNEKKFQEKQQLFGTNEVVRE